jgi:hypothetical protein
MKKKTLKEWKETKIKYYNKLNREQLVKDYLDWFDDDHKPNELTKDEMIEELIESELDCVIYNSTYESDNIINDIEL